MSVVGVECNYLKNVDTFITNFIDRVEAELTDMRRFLKRQKQRFNVDDGDGQDGDGDFIRIDSCYSVDNDDKHGHGGDPLDDDDGGGGDGQDQRSDSDDNYEDNYKVDNYLGGQKRRAGPASKTRVNYVINQTNRQTNFTSTSSSSSSKPPLICPASNCRQQETSHLRMSIHILKQHRNLNDPNYPLWRCVDCEWIGLFKSSLKEHMIKRHNNNNKDHQHLINMDNNNSSLHMIGSRKKTSSFTVRRSAPSGSSAGGVAGQLFYSAPATTLNQGKRGRGRPLGSTKAKKKIKNYYSPATSSESHPGNQEIYTPRPRPPAPPILPTLFPPQPMQKSPSSSAQFPLSGSSSGGEKRGRGRPRKYFPILEEALSSSSTPAPPAAGGNHNMELDVVDENEIVELDPFGDGESEIEIEGERMEPRKPSMISDIAGLIVRQNNILDSSSVVINDEIEIENDYRINFVTPTAVLIKSESAEFDPECQVIESQGPGPGPGHEIQQGVENEYDEILPGSPQSPSIINTNINTPAHDDDDDDDDPQII